MGGRGAKSSIKKAPSHIIDGVKYTYSDKYDNTNVNDYGEWWQDNEAGGLLSDNFMATTGKYPVNPISFVTNSKWDDFTLSEWKKQKSKEDKKRKPIKLSKKQKEAVKRLNKNAEKGVLSDIKSFLSGKTNYSGSENEFIRDLSNEWGVRYTKVEDLLHKESIKHPRNFKR